MTDIRNRFFILLGCVLAGLLFLLPTIFRSTFQDMKWISHPIALGLDLSGGVHLVYEVEAVEAVKSRLQSISNSIRSDMRDAKIALVRSKVLDGNRVEFIFLNDSVAERGKTKIQEINKDLQFVEKTPDGDRSRLVYTVSPSYATQVGNEAVNQAVENLRVRIDPHGVSESLIQKIGQNRILVQKPGIEDVSSIKKLVEMVAKLEFRLIAPPGKTTGTVNIKNKDGATLVAEDEVLMTGEAVDHATVSFDQGVAVSLTLTKEGGRIFRKITTENVGRSLAIILDGVIHSYPNINEPISGGQASISGGFTLDEAQQLAKALRAGALPAPLKVIEERTVGPSLGAESIQKGILAIVGGFIMVAIFMLCWYKKSGGIAVASLLLNLFFIIAILSAFGATLTLPGLAALALTVGVAVDSNVIIFERIKDELWNGTTRDSAIRQGFDKAYSAILDSNLAAMFTGLILYFLGTGAVKGFAVTLIIGVATTMFCAVFASRIAFDYLKLKGGKFGLSI